MGRYLFVNVLVLVGKADHVRGGLDHNIFLPMLHDFFHRDAASLAH
jgi:hypothetical protein